MVYDAAIQMLSCMTQENACVLILREKNRIQNYTQHELNYVKKKMHKRKPERKHAQMLTVVIVSFFFILVYIFQNEHMSLLASGGKMVYYFFSEKM